MLSSLTKGGLKLSVLSGNTHLRMYLDEKGISNYFEPYIISGADVKNKKPDPEGIEKLLVMMKASRSETVLVGDSGSDIEASNSAHIDSILFYPKDHARFYDLKELKAQKPTHIVASHQELEKLLLDQRKEK
jgi:phosphoglycolate phosphatase-like HAD superfamily hydrolase